MKTRVVGDDDDDTLFRRRRYSFINLSNIKRIACPYLEENAARIKKSWVGKELLVACFAYSVIIPIAVLVFLE
jgi:hypothetical protein